MAKNTRWSSEDFRKQGLIETPNGFVKSSTLVNTGKVNKIKPNAKIMNATKSVVDGISFDSNLEKYMYGLLKGAGITFEFQVEYILQEKFRYNGEAVRTMTLTVDFLLPTRNMIIDTKGFKNDVSPVKFKLLKKKLHDLNKYPVIEQPATKKDCDLLLNRLLYQP